MDPQNQTCSAFFPLRSTSFSGFKFLIFMSMLYMSIMLCNAILTNRYIGTDEIFVLGGSFTSPFFFIFGDIIAEIFGYKIARFTIFCGFACQAVFVVICQIVFSSPHPTFFEHQETYSFILGDSLVWITISGFAAYMIANLVNAKIITKWKILLKGRHFWLRSFGSSAFSEALYSAIAILMMQVNSIPLQDILQVVILSFLIKATYSIVLAWPANVFVNYIKRKTGIDVFDTTVPNSATLKENV
ncbi:MAG: queuosine precursor transporter [Legionellales bacterium]